MEAVMIAFAYSLYLTLYGHYAGNNKSFADSMQEVKMRKRKRVEQKKEIIADLSKPETCSEEMLADYFIWVMQRKGSQYIEKIMDIVLEKLKGK